MFDTLELSHISIDTLQDSDSILPDDVYYRLSSISGSLEGVRAYGYFHDVVGMLGIAVYIKRVHTPRAAELFYIETSPWHRGNGYGEKLIEDSLKDLKKKGISRVSAKPFDSISASFVLEKLGLSYKSKELIMDYSGATLKTSKILRDKERLATVLKPVKLIDELPKAARDTFGKEVLKQNGVDIEKLDPVLTQYFTLGGEVLGVLGFCRGDNGGITQTFFHIKKQEKNAAILPTMMAAMIMKEHEGILDDTTVSLSIASPDNRAAMEAGFGVPKRVTTLNVYSANI